MDRRSYTAVVDKRGDTRVRSNYREITATSIPESESFSDNNKGETH